MLKNEKLKSLSLKNKKTAMEISLKLVEETGEVSEAVLKMLGTNGMAYKVGSENPVDNVKEECVDVMMIATSLIYKLDGENAVIEENLEIKSEQSELELALELSIATGEVSKKMINSGHEISKKANYVNSVALSIFYKVGGTKEEIADFLNHKIQKWQKISS